LRLAAPDTRPQADARDSASAFRARSRPPSRWHEHCNLDARATRTPQEITMKPTLQIGLVHHHRFTVTPNKTVPALYPESPDFCTMPAVFATGFMVGLFEWACVELLRPHLDAGEGSLGTNVEFSHVAATPPGLIVEVNVELVKLEGKSLWFYVRGHDGVDVIGEGLHRRALVVWSKFSERMSAKLERARKSGLIAGATATSAFSTGSA
jgi:fluoroacetyl-CoA thioesterase